MTQPAIVATTLPAPTEVGAATAEAHWAWQWHRWTRFPFTLPMVLIAALIVGIDVGTAWASVSIGSFGAVPISPALPLGIVLVAMLGLRRLGLDATNRRAWREFLAVGGLTLAIAVFGWANATGRWDDAAGLIVGALGEELVYRLAVIIVVGTLAARLLGRDWRNASEWGLAPGLAALVAGGFVFSVLPGHVAQMSDALHALPFASLGVLLGYAVLRTGALVPATIVHALLNVATVASVSGEASLVGRNALSVAALVALIAGTIVAGLRLGILRREPTTIDLTTAPANA